MKETLKHTWQKIKMKIRSDALEFYGWASRDLIKVELP